MWAMIVKEFRELRRDRRTVIMLIALPLLLLVVFGYAANFTPGSLGTEVFGAHAPLVAAHLPSKLAVTKVDPAGGVDQARAALVDNQAVVAIVAGADGTLSALVNGSQLFAAQQAVAGLSRAPIPVRTTVLFNPDLKTSWVMIPALIGLILAFIGTVITSLGLVRERQAGTLEQLAVMPFRPSDVIVGKVAPYLLLAGIDMVIVTVLGVIIFHVPFTGNVGVFALGAALFLLVVMGLGILISTLSQNQGQAVQTALMLLLPQILLSGMIFPLSAMPVGIRWIGYCLPLTYFISVSQGVLLRGEGLGPLWLPLVVLAGMAVLVFGLSILRFRRDLAPRAVPARKPVATTPVPAGGAS
jgi:ABC-2 type transport system permease protein